MDFDRNKNGNNLFESKGETKEDKIDRLKKYDEYWNFEKNYHYNSKIDSTIADINKNYTSVKKSEQIKLMKDVINQICGTAAKYIGLSWDMIGDDKYLFGFYETNGSKNHMQILIPYDFKFSALKQKLLDWFLKKKEPSEGGMDSTLQTKPKKPSIKVVESFVKKTSKKNSFDFDSSKDIKDTVSQKLFSDIKKMFGEFVPSRFYCEGKHYSRFTFYHEENFKVKGLPNFRIRRIDYISDKDENESIEVYFYDGGSPVEWSEMSVNTQKNLARGMRKNLDDKFYVPECLKESFTSKVSKKKSSDITPTDIIIPYDVAFQKSLSIIKDNIGVPSIKDGQTLFFGPLGKYDASEELDSNKLFIKFSTDKRVKMDTTAQNNMIDYGCTFYLVFHDDDTFNFYFFIGHNFYPQGRIFYINDQTNTLVRQRGETSNLRKIIYKTKENCMKISAKNFNVVKLFIDRFCKTAYNEVLEKGLTEPYRYHQIEERLIPVFEDYIFKLYTDVLKTLNVESPLINESFVKKTARKTQKDLSSQSDNSIMTVPFQSELMKEMCIHIWGSEESKQRGELLIKDIRDVEEFLTKENWEKVPFELQGKLSSYTKLSEPFNEFRYFTGIKKITKSTFMYITGSLTEITLPESVKEIEDFSFSYNDNIRKITLNEGLEKIGQFAFQSTKCLESIIIPSTVKSIGDSAFKKSGINFIKLNEGLEEIGAKAFAETPNLKTITIPSTVREIGGSVFKCSAIGTNVKIAEGNEHIINIDNILYSSDGTKMIDILGSRRDISDFKIKDGVKVIGDNMFQGTKITEIDIPDSVEEIGNEAFYRVPLKRIHFGKNLKKIGNECFRDCSQIIEMNIPESIESFGDECFMHLSRWGSEESDSRTLDLSKCHNIRYIGSSSFDTVGFEEIILPENPKFLTLNSTFCFSENLKKVIIPEGVKEMKQTFYCCKNLEETNLPSTLEYVLNPFQLNYKLKEFVFDEIPKSWKYYSGLYNIHIKNFVVNADEEGNPKYFVDFSENDEIFKTPMKEATIDNIKFNEGVKVIPSNSFGSLNDSKVLFPSSLEIIEKNAFQRFRNCEIFFKPSKKIPNIHKDAFGWMDGCTIFCDEKKYKSFRNAEKYKKIFRNAEIRLLGDYNSNTFEEGYYEQGTFDSNQFGSHNYAFKILKREFKTITSNDDEIREYWRRYQYRQRMNIKDDEKCPEPVYEVKFNGYIEVPTNQLPDNISNLDIKNKLNEIKIGDEKSLKELLVNIINPTGEEMYKPKAKVIYKDSNEIVFNLSRLIFYNTYRNKVSTKHRSKTIEILFILSYNGKFSESFEDTEIPRLEKYELKILEIEEKERQSYEKNFQREVKRREREEEKLREKIRKQREREDRRRQRELEKIRLKEENRRQREMKKQMKNASSEENQNTNEHRRFDFDSARFLKS